MYFSSRRVGQRIELESSSQRSAQQSLGREDDTDGNPHRARIVRFELFELVLLLKLDKQFPVEQFEATVSQSTVPSPLLSISVRVSVSVGVDVSGKCEQQCWHRGEHHNAGSS